METPLHQEAATADLISDIIAPALQRVSDVSDVARDLASGAANWREAWSVGPPEAEPPDRPALTSPPLNYDEDEELRRLHYLAQIGALAGLKAERLIELRLRDRRSEVRPPRGFVVEENARGKRKWYRFGSR